MITINKYMKYKYKNISHNDLMVPNVGIIRAGETIETNIEINNVNFKRIYEEFEKKVDIKEENKEKQK